MNPTAPQISGGSKVLGTSRPPVPGTVTALTVHGPHGVLDLTVPVDATLDDVSRAYSAEAGLTGVLPLVTRAGEPLRPALAVGAAGLVSGSVVVAVDPSERPAAPGSRHRPGVPAGRPHDAALVASGASAAWCALAAVAAVVAGWCAAPLPAEDRWPVVAVLLATALLGCLPWGPLRSQRVLAAPAFAAAAGLALAWDPLPERLPMVCGIAALCAAVTAAVGRALADRDDPAAEGLGVWMVVGAGWFVLASLGALTGVAPQVVWAVLLLAAVLSARFVPDLAVDVPDHYLLDLDRLAVTAWSARGRSPGRRDGVVVPARTVHAVAARGARVVTAAAVAVLVGVVVTTPLLLLSADLPLDRVGARCLVGFGGAALLFAARGHRHVGAARLLRLAGVLALAALTVVLLGAAPGSRGPIAAPAAVAAGAISVAAVLVLAAVSVGRGWRSAWWSRRAEIGEVVCGACTVASLVVAVGLFRHLWEVAG